MRVSLPIQPLQLWGYIAQQGAYRENNCDVTLPWWQNFWISTICLDRDGRKKRMGYCFVPECNPAQESHTCQVFSFFFSAILVGLRLLLRSTNFATPNHPTTPPPPHTPYMQLSVYPVHARSDIKVHILQNVPFAFAVVQKIRDLLILTDILHIANVFFRLQWYFCLFLGCF